MPYARPRVLGSKGLLYRIGLGFTGFRVHGLGFRTQGLGLRIQDLRLQRGHALQNIGADVAATEECGGLPQTSRYTVAFAMGPPKSTRNC